MLETRELCKTYKPKKGVPVTAVDHVSLRFPEKGMVFLLGKSGSGKSTLLNLLGGLDQYDGGEIIIKGISSKDFSQQRFDSYRNTYVGFIFQEYNVLEEFSVGANIALALELQGKKATDEELNRILTTVDLTGFGSRKPNELSGGQKQRVAIARALVKNPEIIMADEPTGALDSATGRQVLDTLKKLSAEKLVIIVSHDREYAEAYADRIIELADGKVIRDVEVDQTAADSEEKQLRFRQTSIEIPADYHLTEEDRIRINEYLDKLKSGASIMLPSNARRFAETDQSKIPAQDGSKFYLIKSRLPLGSAFKIGCSSLKHKRFRLVMTILLSVVAFTLFSLVDTFGSFDIINSSTDSIIDSGQNYLSINRKARAGSEKNPYYTTTGQHFTDEQIKQVSEDLGIPMVGIFCPVAGNLKFTSQYDTDYKFSEEGTPLNYSHFCGFAEISEQMLKDMDYKLVAGSLPADGKNEIAISRVLCDTFVKAGYLAPDKIVDESPMAIGMDGMPPEGFDGMNPGTAAADTERIKPEYEKIASEQDMIGKEIRLLNTNYTVTGVVDTKMDMSRYQKLTESTEGISRAEQVVRYLLLSEFRTDTNYSLSGCAMVGKNIIGGLAEQQPKIYQIADGDLTLSNQDSANEVEAWIHGYFSQITKAELLKSENVIWVDGAKTSLADNEIIVPFSNLYYNSNNSTDNTEALFTQYQTGMKKLDAEAAKTLVDKIKSLNPVLYRWGVDPESVYWKDTSIIDSSDLKIVGFFAPGSNYDDVIGLSESMFERYLYGSEGIYDSAIGAMPGDRAGVRRAVAYCYQEGVTDPEYMYEINSAEALEIDMIGDALKDIAKVFFWIGVGFAIFASLLMANFITTSIHYKRQEIGILRAIGSRSADVFRIFFSESFVIAMINFALSCAGCITAVRVINYFIREEGILITVLHFGARQVILLIAVSLAVAALASFFPVMRIASKKPIDAIRDK